MAKTKLTLGLCVVAGVACASSFSRTMDQLITWTLVGAAVAVALYGLGWWWVGEWLLDRECRRPNPQCPPVQPRYKEEQGAGS